MQRVSSLRMKTSKIITKRPMTLRCLISAILFLMHYQGSLRLLVLLLLVLSNNQLKIFITNGLFSQHLRIRTILRNKIICSKTVQARSSRVTIFLHLTNKRITTLTTTIILAHCLIQVTTINEVISSSQDLNNMRILITEIWRQHQTTQVINSNRGDRVATTITIRVEGVPATPAIMLLAPQRFPKATKVYPLLTMLHRQCKMRLLHLNRLAVRQLEEYNLQTISHKQLQLLHQIPTP